MTNNNLPNINLLLETKINKVNTKVISKVANVNKNEKLLNNINNNDQTYVASKVKTILDYKETNISDRIDLLKYRSKLDALDLNLDYLKIPRPSGYLRPYLQDNNLFKVGQLENKNVFNVGLAINQFTTFEFVNSTKLPFAKAANLLKLSFLAMGCLISRPMFKVVYASNPLALDQESKVKVRPKIIISLFYFIRNKRIYILKRLISRNNKLYENSSALNKALIQRMNANILVKFNDKFQGLMEYLTTIFNTEIQLDLVKLNRPYYNSNILVQELALTSYKSRFAVFIRKVFRDAKFVRPTESYNMIGSYPSYLSGIFAKSAGRVFRETIIPKKTVKHLQVGSLSKENVLLIEKSRFTGKTKRGSYSFTVKIGHIFH